VVSLLPDGRLTLRSDDAVSPFVEPWLPLNAPQRQAASVADIEVHFAAAAPTEVGGLADDGAPLLRLGCVSALRQRNGDIALVGAAGVSGRIEVGGPQARIDIADAAFADGATAAHGDVYTMLTISAAFVLGLKGMALVHAGAVADPTGRAWIVVGDSHCGKTSTCTALADAGWSFLADDQIVLAEEGEVLRVWGWPRAGHLDRGWERRAITGEREVASLVTRWPSRWVRAAPLGGLLLPRVEATSPTLASRVHAADALAAVIRQSPWLVADARVAMRVLPLLEEASRRPAYALRLGEDSYARGDVLEQQLGAARD
jgi:hypothetical protein